MHRRYQSNSFFGQCNNTFFKAADIWLHCTTPPSLSPINQHPFHLQSTSKSMPHIKSAKVAPSVLFLSQFSLLIVIF